MPLLPLLPLWLLLACAPDGNPDEKPPLDDTSDIGDGITPSALSLAIPSYCYPGPTWDQAVAGAPAVGLLIANPASGPGAGRDVTYADAIAAAQAAGITVLGYVATGWGAREKAEVLDEVALYRGWYGVSGIFFDEVSGEDASEDVARAYLDLAQEVHAAGEFVAFNPGTCTRTDLAAAADLTYVFESDALAFSGWRLSSACPALVPSADRLGILVYAADEPDMVDAIRVAGEDGLGWAYVTDDDLPNPWDTLPDYWEHMVDLVDTAR